MNTWWPAQREVSQLKVSRGRAMRVPYLANNLCAEIWSIFDPRGYARIPALRAGKSHEYFTLAWQNNATLFK